MHPAVRRAETEEQVRSRGSGSDLRNTQSGPELCHVCEHIRVLTADTPRLCGLAQYVGLNVCPDVPDRHAPQRRRQPPSTSGMPPSARAFSSDLKNFYFHV